MLLDISAHYPWAMGVLLGDVHPSELERLDKPCARVRIELATVKSSVDNSDHSAKSKIRVMKFSFLIEPMKIILR